MARDVTDLKQIEGRLADQAAVLELIASGEPIDVSLDVLASDLAALDEGNICAVLLTSRTDPERSRRSRSPAIDAGAARHAGRAAGRRRRGLAGPRGRCCGEAIFVDDIETDPDSAPFRERGATH